MAEYRVIFRGTKNKQLPMFQYQFVVAPSPTAALKKALLAPHIVDFIETYCEHGKPVPVLCRGVAVETTMLLARNREGITTVEERLREDSTREPHPFWK